MVRDSHAARWGSPRTVEAMQALVGSLQCQVLLGHLRCQGLGQIGCGFEAVAQVASEVGLAAGQRAAALRQVALVLQDSRLAGQADRVRRRAAVRRRRTAMSTLAACAGQFRLPARLSSVITLALVTPIIPSRNQLDLRTAAPHSAGSCTRCSAACASPPTHPSYGRDS